MRGYYLNGTVKYIEEADPPFRDKNEKLEMGYRDGPFTMFTKAGMALEKGMQKNSLRTGHWKNYYENGKLRMEGNYVEGNKTGV